MEATQQVERTSGITGTDVAKIVGVSPHGTRFSVYCDKLGLLAEDEAQPETERMVMGRVLEPVVVQLYERKTKSKVEWFDKTLRHPKEPLIIGTPDGFLDDRCKGFEAKTAGLDQAWRWGTDGDLIPQEYIVQVQWYMLLTGLSQWGVGALIGGDMFRTFMLEAHPETQGLLLAEAKRFWKDHVEKRQAPQIDASEAARAYLKRTYPHGVEAPREATRQEAELLASVVRAKAERKHVELELTLLENRLKESIGTAKGIYDPESQVRANWSEVKESNIAAFTRAAYRRLDVRSKREEN